MAYEHWLVSYSRQVNSELPKMNSTLLEDDPCIALTSDIKNYPHAFVLACCMDRQVSFDRAWRIPFAIKSLCPSFTINELAQVTLEDYKQVFTTQSLHRYNDMMAEVFYKAVHRIKDQYGGDASRIWSDRPSSSTVVYRFLQFEGVGIKIASMAANLLAREYGVEFSDYFSLDISPDVHVIRVFERTELIEKGASREAVVYRARSLNPSYPGIVDAACWQIGRSFCHPTAPDCLNCPISAHCATALADDVDESLFDASK